MKKTFIFFLLLFALVILIQQYSLPQPADRLVPEPVFEDMESYWQVAGPVAYSDTATYNPMLVYHNVDLGYSYDLTERLTRVFGKVISGLQSITVRSYTSMRWLSKWVA